MLQVHKLSNWGTSWNAPDWWQWRVWMNPNRAQGLTWCYTPHKHDIKKSSIYVINYNIPHRTNWWKTKMVFIKNLILKNEWKNPYLLFPSCLMRACGGYACMLSQQKSDHGTIHSFEAAILDQHHHASEILHLTLICETHGATWRKSFEGQENFPCNTANETKIRIIWTRCEILFWKLSFSLLMISWWVIFIMLLSGR